MRKLLGFLVAAVFVTAVASSAMAQAVNIVLTSTTPGTGQKASFMAEVIFTVSGNFGFVLRKAADGALPNTATDGSYTKVDWLNKAGANLISGVAPQTPGWKNSQVYAEVTNELNPGTSVQFYTENATSGDEYQYHASADLMNINPLVETVGGAATPNHGLPLAYVFVSSETVYTLPKSTEITKGGAPLTSIANVHIMDNDGTDQSLYAWFVKDKARVMRPFGTNWVDPVNPLIGDPGDTAYTKKDATIALNNALQRGNRAVPRSPYLADNVTPDPGYNTANPTGSFWYVPAEKAFMFFSTNFENALGGFKYGTNTLTLEMTVDGSY